MARPRSRRSRLPHRHPPTVQSRFLGRLSFQDGYPTTETMATLYDALDYQRAVQVMLRNLAAHSITAFAWVGARSGRRCAQRHGDLPRRCPQPDAHAQFGDAVRATFLRLDTDGPTVVEAPPGVLGLVDDMWMRPVEDIGVGGPDAGKGGKYLFVPPGYSGPLPQTGYFTIPTRTYGHWFILRAFLSPTGDTAPAFELLKRTRVYPLSQRDAPPPMRFVDATGKTLTPSRPATAATSTCSPSSSRANTKTRSTRNRGHAQDHRHREGQAIRSRRTTESDPR